jgi:hypothetical protein
MDQGEADSSPNGDGRLDVRREIAGGFRAAFCTEAARVGAPPGAAEPLPNI